jgi:hypothetical protein
LKDAPGGLLLQVQRGLESLYALEPGAPVTDFVIPSGEADVYPGDGSRTLVSERPDGLSVGVILDGVVCAELAERDPRTRLDGGNMGSFCVLTEEVSHFLLLLFRARCERPVSQLELELQAEVDKYLTAIFFLSLQNEGAVSTRLRSLLFRRYRLAADLPPERAERYRAASDFAERYCGWLETTFLRPARLGALTREARRFYRLGQREKLETIAEIS